MKNKNVGAGQYDYSNHINNSTIINMIILIILIIVLLLSLFLINKTLKKKDIKLDNDNKINENTIKRKQFSMFVENDNGEYDEYNSSNMFPDGYYVNIDKSKCVDNNGLEVKNVLSGSGNKVTVTSNKTVFCYIYFDKKEILSEYLIENVSSDVLWNSPLEDDGYRFVGTNPDNYVCFGTNDTSTCTSNPDKYMYRIIGIFEDSNGNKHTKLIKKEALNTGYAWDSDNKTDTDWNESDLYKGLNESYFLTNTEYSYMQDSTWTDKIATWNYTMANTKSYDNYSTNSVYGPTYYFETGKTIYLHELNRSGKSNESCHYNSSTSANCNAGEWNTVNAKIGLMYVSDYMLSLGSTALSYTSISNYSTLKTGWMHISNNDSDAPNGLEWTMSRYGKGTDGYYYPWDIRTDGAVTASGTVAYTYAVRPVFYLKSNVEYDGGKGTIDNPIMISSEDKSVATTLINTVSSEELWNSPLEDDGYRYVGTNPNNYICFGTTDKDTCTGDTDKYMYRIIGIFNGENGVQHAKLIKKEALNTAYAWNSSSTKDVDWNNSKLYNGLNGSYFLTNTSYPYMQDSTWTDKIATWNYIMTNTKSYENYINNSVYGLYYSQNTGKVVYLHELNRSSKSNETCYYNYGTSPADADCNAGEWKNLSTKVGLMYASDYALSLGSDALKYISQNDYSTMKTGWMHISNNDSGTPSSYEWTMSRIGKSTGDCYAWLVYSDGPVAGSYVETPDAVRPVFYLASDVELSTNSGDGSITNPYLLK